MRDGCSASKSDESHAAGFQVTCKAPNGLSMQPLACTLGPSQTVPTQSQAPSSIPAMVGVVNVTARELDVPPYTLPKCNAKGVTSMASKQSIVHGHCACAE
eukprot:10565807-Alexandrium_andersonii.AAC.1